MSQTPNKLPGVYRLTPGEVKMLDLMAVGLTAKAIAGVLQISEHTARNKRRLIFAKLQTRCATHAVAVWVAYKSTACKA